MNLGVSQSRAGVVVEKHRANGKAANGVDRPVQFQSVNYEDEDEKFRWEDSHVGRKKAICGPANIFN